MVKPHKGVIAVNGEVNIAITLLPFNYKPDEAYRDKFLIQVIFSPKKNQEPKTKNGMKETWMKNVFYTLNNSGILPGFLSVKHSIVDSRKSPENLTSWFGSILMFSEFGLNIAMLSNCL